MIEQRKFEVDQQVTQHMPMLFSSNREEVLTAITYFQSSPELAAEATDRLAFLLASNEREVTCVALEAISRTYVNPSETVDASNFFVTQILGPILDRKNDLADDFHVLQPIECAGLFLRNIRLSGITISDADLADLTLENVDMSLSIINHTNLTGANFGEVFWGTSNRARTGWIYFSDLSYARFNRSRILGASAGLPRFVENTMIGTLFDYPDVYQISWVDPWGPDLQHATCMPLMRALKCYNYHKSIYYGNDALTDSPENCPAVLRYCKAR